MGIAVPILQIGGPWRRRNNRRSPLNNKLL